MRRHDGGVRATVGNRPRPGGDVQGDRTRASRDDEETTTMAEHGRAAGGRHAAPGEPRQAPGTTATVGTPSGAAPTGTVRPGTAPAGPGLAGSASLGAAAPAAASPGTAAPGAASPDTAAAPPTAPIPGTGARSRSTRPVVGTPEPTVTTSAVGTPEDDEAPDDVDDLGAPVRGTGWVLLIGGLVGAVVALVLLIEKLDLLANPDYIPSCSIDPVLSCGTIMKTAQASVLGFPNPVIGLLTFPVVAACGAFVLSGAELPRWVWWALEAGSFVGVLFIHWLIVQSLVTIHALCPYCMVAWVAVIAIFWFTTMHNLREGNLGGEPAGDTLARRHGWGLGAWYLLVIVAIVASFPSYFGAMVGLA
ncbi:vitamin K epoxide reductase family protein [Actinomycetospora endophytica]|uniref:Vitamin K epoxide reductase family protein n=1 Tax=Actinomycetospora endophytica TaxID=2291215 RepID=A0ABS8P2I3_9PSEU|nr:vitamin K epoxide reductase family protein [Actinomycetospora endophytica]MCD2192202.1 vitamin K epoxide reductase family protein [Actinomycetospora endophytica]